MNPRSEAAFMRRLGALAVAAALVLILAGQAVAQQTVTVYFFWGNGCPHCAEAEPFLARLAQDYPGVEVRDFELYNHPENHQPFIEMAAKFGFEPTSVPTIFAGDRYWVGFAAETIGREIEAYVASCAAAGCPDAGAGVPSLMATAPARTPTPDPSPTGAAPTAAPGATPGPTGAVVSLPLIGLVDLGAHGLVLSTAVIAFVDGFNPCSLWVLSMLLALTLHTGSRRRVFIIGLVFLTVTSLVYALFIAGLFTVFTVISFVGWIRVIVALVALFFAAINIKDYFWYKRGISLTIADDHKPGLFRRMRRVLSAGDSLPALIGATVVLSAGASLVEFSCTAGFPLLWTNLLTAQQVGALAFVLLLVLYMLVYQVDEMGIFLAAVLSLRASKLEEKQGRILKLIGGMLMLALALVMLIEPGLMNRIGTSLLVFGGAFGVSIVVLLVHRMLLPRLGLRA